MIIHMARMPLVMNSMIVMPMAIQNRMKPIIFFIIVTSELILE